jgi:1,4-alpha-glucan branching enzyme
MLFMGEEWSAAEPFPFFCDFAGDLAEAVREGRRQEFARFAQFADPEIRKSIPDPGAIETFRAGRLDWQALATPTPARRLAFVADLLALRRREVMPLLDAGCRGAQSRLVGARALEVAWRFADDRQLILFANFDAADVAGFVEPTGRCLWQRGDAETSLGAGRLAGWGGAWYRRDGGGG